MSQYGILLPGFWGGDTGKAIADLGGAPAQLLALYLTANPDGNMIGLYPIELPVVRVRIRTLSTKAMAGAFDALQGAGFADFDASTSVVWVREMAKFRLGLHQHPLKRHDNRVIGAAKLYAQVKPNPFLEPFFERYEGDLHLTTCRAFKGVASPFEGASKPVNRNSKQKHQTQVQERASGDPARADAPFALSGDKAEHPSGRRSAKASPTRELLEAFDQAHRARFSGQAAAINGGKDAKLMAEIWQQRGGDTDVVRQLIALFFASTDPYIARAGYTVGVFKSQIGKLVVELVRQARPTPGRGTLPTMSAPVQELCEAAALNQHTIFSWFRGVQFGATNGPTEMHLEVGPASELEDTDTVQTKLAFIQRHYGEALANTAQRLYGRTLVIRGPIAPSDQAVSA